MKNLIPMPHEKLDPNDLLHTKKGSPLIKWIVGEDD